MPPADTASLRRDAVIQAALTLFSSRGYEGTAMPDVAREAQVGTGTIYRYFDSKETLVNAVFREAKSLLREFLMSRVPLTAPAREAFHHFWWALVAFARTHPREFRFLELQDHVPYLDTDSRNVELQVLAPIWAFCVTARRSGVARDMASEGLMALIWGAFVGLMKAEYTGHLRVNDALLQAAEDACWAAFAAPAD